MIPVEYLRDPVVLTVAGALIHWGRRVDKALMKTTVILGEMEKRLNGHDARVERLERLTQGVGRD